MAAAAAGKGAGAGGGGPGDTASGKVDSNIDGTFNDFIKEVR